MGDERGWTTLHLAAGAGDLDAVDTHLRTGADAHGTAGYEDRAGRTALHCAVDPSMGRADDAARAAVVARLLDAGTPIDSTDADEMTPLLVAASAGFTRCCECLLDRGATPHAVDRRRGWTALHWTRSPQVVALLIERGADVNAPAQLTFDVTRQPGGARLVFPVGCTPADVAVLDGRPAIADLLVRHGGRWVTTADRTEAQLAYVDALAHNEIAMVCELVGRHGIEALRSGDEPPPLVAAIQAHNRELASALLEAGHPLDSRDGRGRTPLLAAVEYSELGLAQLLVARGADLFARDSSGATALHHTRDLGTIEWLVGAGLDVDTRDARGRRALHRACSDGDAPRVLLAAGAAPDDIDDDGLTPLGVLLHEHVAHYALAARIAVLLEAGASPDVKVRSGPRGASSPGPLVLISKWVESKESKYRDALAILLRGGANPDVADPSGWTAMHEAAYRRHDEAIGMLREARARTDVATIRRVRRYGAGTTAADVARDRGLSW